MDFRPNTFDTTLKGMLHKLKMIKIIADNISKSNSIGYKRQIPESLSFNDILNEIALKDNSQGDLKKTGNLFDIAIEGNASFLIETPNGLVETRSGDFKLNNSGEIATQDGNPLVIVDKTDKEVKVSDTYDIKINQKGEIYIDGNWYGRIALKISDNKPIRLHQGYIEGSNVDLATEMTTLTMTFRTFEASEKTLGMEASIDKELIEKYGRNV